MEVMIPREFLGTGGAVYERMRTVVKGMSTVDGPLDDNAFGELLSLDSCPEAQIVCRETDRKYPGTHFHSYAFFHAIVERFSVQGVVRWFTWSLANSWRFLGVMGGIGKVYFQGTEGELLRTRYLQTALRLGPSLEALGWRFVYVGRKQPFSDCCVGVKRVLEDAGVSSAHLSGDAFFDVIREHLEAIGAADLPS